MDALCLKSLLINSCLKSLIEELVDSQTQNVIEFELLVAEKTITMHSVKKGSTFEQSSWIFFLESEQLSSSLSEVGKKQVDSPNFTLVLEAVLADKLQLMINSLFLERTTRSVES